MNDFDIMGKWPCIQLRLTENLENISDAMLEEVQNNFLTSGRGTWPALKTGEPRRLMGAGILYGALRKKFGEDSAQVFVDLDVGTVRSYAFIQNFGGTTHPTVTEKSRRFFWAKFYETDDPMWKAMALKPLGSKLNVVIPQARYMWFYNEAEMMARFAMMLGHDLFTITYP